MSSLKPVEKELFEDIFEMRGGYVLDFSNNTFAGFFRDTVKIDIFSSKYVFIGDSKAKRLRAFWEIEPDVIVGKTLSEMMEIWIYKNQSRKTDPRYNECQSIIGRLLGVRVVKEDTEKEFLKKKFEKININKLPIEANLFPILNNRLTEANMCLQSNSSLAVILLCGSILEGILLGLAMQKQREFNQATNSPKDKEGKVKPFYDWSLAQFIDVAYELGFLMLDVKKFSHGLRDFRNYIHPYQQLSSGFNPDRHTAEICLQVLKAAIACLNGERN